MRAGVSYPIIRFVSAFAEVGASYYFDNGSEIETIHSEKPFNMSLQFGFRLVLILDRLTSVKYKYLKNRKLNYESYLN